MSPLLEAFSPISAPDARVLILGSMPGAESLRKREYYGHPRNAFWPIMAALFDVPELPDYDAKMVLLIAHRIALWDVAFRCRRPGSLDQHIREEEPNDFPGFFVEHPGIVGVFLNGTKAYELFRRYVTPCPGISVIRLPSTSPAYTLPFAEKLEAWRVIGEVLDGPGSCRTETAIRSGYECRSFSTSSSSTEDISSANAASSRKNAASGRRSGRPLG